MRLPPKKTLRRLPIVGTARFLTFSTFRRLRLFDNDRIKDHFVERLSAALTRHDVSLLAWVVMPEHIHLITFADDPDYVTAFLRTLKRPFARAVLSHWRSVNASILPKLRDRRGEKHFWQAGGGYDRNVVGDELIEKIAYIHTNPVKRGLSVDAISWKWSSAAAYEGLPEAFGPPTAFDLVPSTSRDLI